MLLSKLLQKREKGYHDKESVLREEFEFVRNALFTDPDDQSGWFYHMWLLDQTLKREPLFLSSWPPNGSNLNLSIDCPLNGQQQWPMLHFQSKERKIPLILYFNEAVEGVNTSTVTVEFDYLAENDLIWRPLSVNKNSLSQAWLTYIMFPDDVEVCPVKITIAQFPGIFSSSGMPCSQSSFISFTVSLPSNDRKYSEVIHRVSWNEDNFKACVTQSQEALLLHSLCKLDITKENKPTTSARTMKTISNEITHCRELLSVTNWYAKFFGFLWLTLKKLGVLACFAYFLTSLLCSKIGKLILARLLMAHNAMVSYGCPNARVEAHYEDILALYHDLMKMDPAHICYYEDEYSLVLLKQVNLLPRGLSV